MIILQTASGGDAGRMNLEALLHNRRHAPATTFRNDGYIHQLNRALQREMRTLAACHRQLTAYPGLETLQQAITDHHMARQELIRLVIVNHGVPEDKTALSLGLTGTFIRVCSAIPVRWFERVSFSTLVALEKNLAAAYRRLLKQAPLRDQETLETLRQLATKHQTELTYASYPRAAKPR